MFFSIHATSLIYRQAHLYLVCCAICPEGKCTNALLLLRILEMVWCKKRQKMVPDQLLV